jgi:hypothetical protein
MRAVPALVAVAAIAVAAPARAQSRTVRVEVVEVAGGRAYLSPGAGAGLAAGDTVVLGGKRYRVVDATADNAAIDVGSARIAIGARGTARVAAPGAAGTAKRLATPRPLDVFRAQWPDAVHPAETQEVEHVPLGSGRARGRLRVAVVGSGLAIAPRSGPVTVSASVGARVTAETYGDQPFAVDADAAAQIFHATGGDAAARPAVVVREARVRWGTYADPRLAAGRLRWAATSIGLLDGARVAAHLGPVEVAGFGGLVPDPISGKPSVDASRFGAEVVVDRPRAAWAPRLSLTASGSTWKGQLDERRLTAVGDATRGALSLAGYAEASAPGSGNPWGDPAVDLAAAGAGATWHARRLRLGVDLSFRRPEHSLRLDAYLPPDWTCIRRVEAPGAASEPCTSNQSRAQATASGALQLDWGSVDAGVTAIHATGSQAPVEASGFADLRITALPAGARLELGGSAGRAAFLDWASGRVAVGVGRRRLDVALYYRPSLLGYVASTSRILEHRAGVDVTWMARHDLAWGAVAEGVTGADVDAVTVLTTVVWRPL